MAATQDTLRLASKVRLAVDDTVDATTQNLVVAWNRAWSVVVQEWEEAAHALVDASDGGRTPGFGAIMREERAQRAFAATRALLNDLSEQAGVQIVSSSREAIEVALDGRSGVVGSQLPAANRAEAVANFNRVDDQALDAIVRRSTHQIESTLRPLSSRAAEAMLRSLVKGVAVGDNPTTAAQEMVNAVQGHFNGGLTRAMVIARTEILDAHRNGAARWDAANTDVLQGWQWLSALDKRTCPSCWSKHGSTYSVSDSGPLDHQQGRCARLPVVRSWKDLGFKIPEPPSLVPDAQSVFNSMPESSQLDVMGAKRLELLKSGQVSWGQLSQLRTTSGWRDSFAPTSLRDLTSR